MKAQNLLLWGLGAFALYKIVKASRSKTVTSSTEEFKNAVSPTTGANQKIKLTKCGCTARSKVIETGNDYYIERRFKGDLYTSNLPFTGSTGISPTGLPVVQPFDGSFISNPVGSIFRKCVENSDCGYTDNTISMNIGGLKP